jgi:tryptophan-rich sensory protein
MNILKKLSWKNIIYFVCPLLLYILPNLFFKIDKEYYYSLNGPHLPPLVFIIVWSIIYVLMSVLIAYYIDLYIKTKDKSLIKLFVFIGINYIFNILYVPTFFMFK